MEVSFARHGQDNRFVAPPSIINRPGQVITKKLRVVCGVCNNTWMSRIENEAKSILIQAFDGQTLNLDNEKKRKLTEWIALKTMISEFSKPGDNVTSESERAAFRLARKVPGSFCIFLGACGVGKWRSAHFRQAATYTLPGKVPTRLAPKNTQTVTIGFGTLVIFVLAQPKPELFGINTSREVLVQLWPCDDQRVVWPPATPMKEGDVDSLSHFLDQVRYRGNVVWRTNLPS